ncbi:MAG: radical SAM family heme chaperone HemW [Candidatus Izemoplasmatales bacterium]|nr:radical SAM family heme chaperone HemW [Candidatus Izemoplasmatales bacterium]
MIKGLYIHIPFCDQICTYCDFAKMVAGDELKVDYVRALIKELEYFSDLAEHAQTIYIGGGTPSSLDIDLLEAFLSELSTTVNLKGIEEFTIEANPCDVSDDLLKLFKKYHVNRISMGVQSTDEGLLKFLGRNHTLESVIKAVELIKKYNFNLNLDFLYAVPGQTEEMIRKDLDFIKMFDPQHVSYYSLIVEDRTIINHLINTHKVADFPDDLARDFADIIDQYLEDLGYDKYEVSNYCKSGFESKHNLIYWNVEEYLGIGLNASSQYNYIRMKNPKSIKEYIAGTKKNALNMHQLEDYNPKLELLLLGLRKTKGVNLEYYKSRIKKDVFEVYPILSKHLENKLLELKDGYLKFTKNGMYLANQVYIDII